MTSKLVPEFKSKAACPACGKHKLYTNDSEKDDSDVRYHCLSCNHISYENGELKDFRKKREKAQRDKPSTSYGITIVAMMLIAILLIMLEQNRDPQPAGQPVNQIEQLN